MEDIGIKLLDEIKKDFSLKYKNSKKIKQLLLKIKKGDATFEDAHDFSIEVGELLSSSYSKYITVDVLPDGRMYWNIAKTVLEPTLGKNFELVSEFSSQVQKLLNKKAGLGLNPVKSSINQDKVYGIMNKIANAGNYDDVAWVLNEPIVNFSQSVVDDVISKNVEFHYKSGLHPTITRVVMGNCCEWCRNLGGTYSYPDKVPTNFYRRHRDCRCMVLYDPKDGQGIQNSHTKEWNNENDLDYMGKQVRYNIPFKGKSYRVVTYENEKYPNIDVQTYTLDSQRMCEYLNETINKTNEFGKLDRIVIGKYENMKGIGAYDHSSDMLFISEEMIDEKKFNELVDISKFPARNVRDILTHELKGHKAHWDAVKRYANANHLSQEAAKEQLEENLRKYIINQMNYNSFYLQKNISENASAYFKQNRRLNEAIADGIVLIERNELKDAELGSLIMEVLNYDGNAR